MPFASNTVDAPGTDAPGEILIFTESGHLVAVTFEPSSRGTGNNEAFGMIYLASTETPEPTRIALLTQGGMGAQNGITWTGRIKLYPTYAIIGRVWSQGTANYKLHVTTEVE